MGNKFSNGRNIEEPRTVIEQPQTADDLFIQQTYIKNIENAKNLYNVNLNLFLKKLDSIFKIHLFLINFKIKIMKEKRKRYYIFQLY
jgi:hypothetical protein